jgi:uncharacterized protein YjiS (DUF1127 family)
MTSIGLSLPRVHFNVDPGRAVHALLARWQRARRLAETRRTLAQMDDHMLADLGVSRAQAYFEVDEARHRDLR